MTTRSYDALSAADQLVAAAQMLAPALKDGERITRRKMNAVMADAFGTTARQFPDGGIGGDAGSATIGTAAKSS